MIAKKSRQEVPDLKLLPFSGLFPNSRISYINTGAGTLPITEHHMVKIPKRKACVYCGGAKVWGPPI